MKKRITLIVHFEESKRARNRAIGLASKIVTKIVSKKILPNFKSITSVPKRGQIIEVIKC